MNAIEAKGVTKTFAGLFGRNPCHALRGVDLEIPAGTAFGMIGLNGAGKTTFIKALLAILRPEKGDIKVLGESPEKPSVRKKIGYLPERLHLPGVMTPMSFLKGVARIKRLDRPVERATQQLERVGLAGDRATRIGGFSKGMKQRLGLAAALIGSPELLVLDEPTDGIDPLGRAEIRRILVEELARGATVYLNSHLLSETERVCDRVGIIDDGRIVKSGTLSELCGTGDRYKLVLEKVPDNAFMDSCGFTPGDNETEWFLTAPRSDELMEKLDRLRAADISYVELGPVHKELEEVLTDAVGEVKP